MTKERMVTAMAVETETIEHHKTTIETPSAVILPFKM